MGNLVFLHSFYDRGRLVKTENGSWQMESKDFLFFTIKNCDTNETHFKIIPEPTIDFWTTATRDYTYPQLSMPENKLIKHTCKYRDRDFVIADTLGLKGQFIDAARQRAFYDDNNKRMDPKRMFVRKNIINSPFVYAADFDIEDQYKNYFMELNGRDTFLERGVFRHSFLDIECDQSEAHYSVFNFTAPINSITYFDSHTNTLYAFELFDQPDNPDMLFVKNNTEAFLNECVRPVAFGEYNYSIQFFDTEASLLLAFINVLHLLKPDFVGIWNMNFDIPYVINRLKYLGVNPIVLCHPDIPEEYRTVRYLPDPRRDLPFEQRGSDSSVHPSRLWDWCNISGYTQFYDMMALYSHIRKRSILPSYKLDDIAEKETGHGKVDYHVKGYNMRRFARQDYKLFLTYSIIDTLRLRQIEDKTDDLKRQIIFVDNTRLSKGDKVSITIKNKMYRFYYDKTPREIIGNNVWYDYYEKLDGAIIASPKNLRIKGHGAGENSSGFVYDDVVDFDEAALYPSSIIDFNIGKETVAARIYAITSKGSPIGNYKEFNPMLQTLDTSLFDLGKMYFNLPSVEDIMSEIDLIGGTKCL